MVALVNDHRVENALQRAKIHDIAGLGIGFAAHRNLQHIVVTVPVRIGAKAVVLHIPLLAFRRVMETVRRVEMNLPRDDHRAFERAHGGRIDFGLCGFLRHREVIR